MRQMLGTLVLGTVLAAGVATAYAPDGIGLSIPPLDPMGAAAALVQADDPGVQMVLDPYWVVQHEDNQDSGANQ